MVISDERLSEIRTYWAGAHKERHVVELLAEVDRLRAAVVAYEAEQPAPDLDGLPGLLALLCDRAQRTAISDKERSQFERAHELLARALSHLKGETR
jgi:hypothetical protein